MSKDSDPFGPANRRVCEAARLATPAVHGEDPQWMVMKSALLVFFLPSLKCASVRRIYSSLSQPPSAAISLADVWGQRWARIPQRTPGAGTSLRGLTR